MPRSTFASLATIIMLGVTLTSACGDIEIGLDDAERLEGSGALVTWAVEVADFDAIDLSHAFDAKVTAGSEFALSLTVDDNVRELVETSVSGSKLRVGLDGGWSLRNVTLRAEITMPELTSIELSGASHAEFEGFAPIDELRLEASGASSFDGALIADRLTVRLDGASRAILRGEATEADLDASGASRFELTDLEIDTCDVGLSGASSADLTVSGRLDADLSGAAHLEYAGDPRLGDVSTAGGSTINSR